jgi:hypothetical protein
MKYLKWVEIERTTLRDFVRDKRYIIARYKLLGITIYKKSIHWL